MAGPTAIDPSLLELPSVEELAEQGASEESEEHADPRDERVYTFYLDYADRRGKKWTGHFTTKILSIKEERARGILQAKLAGGVPFETLDPTTASINAMLAHMAICLESRPDWAKALENLVELDVLRAIYAEVESHVAHYFRLGPIEAESDIGQ